MDELLFRVLSVGKRFSGRAVLSGLDLELRTGQFVALLGANGSGKSTLMRLLAQREMPDSGELFFRGQSMTSPFVPLGAELAFVDEGIALDPPRNLRWWTRVFSEAQERYEPAIVETLAADLQLDLEARFNDLSRGQKAKALFALQAAKRPSVYLLDEISAVLDSGSRFAMMRFLCEERARGALIVMSSNTASEMNAVATDVVVLEQGRIVLSEPVRVPPKSFVKFRATDWASLARLKERVECRAVRIEADGTIVAVALRSNASFVALAEEDRRSVSLEDVSLYFTDRGGESR